MKTILTAGGNTTASFFDPRFGRSAWFCIYDEMNEEIEFIQNSYLNDEHEAGINAAKLMVKLEADRIISGHFGLKANHVLDKNEIQMVILSNTETTIKDIIEQLQQKKK